MLTTLIVLVLGVTFRSTSVQGRFELPASQFEATNNLAELAIWESLGISDDDFVSDDNDVTNLGIGPKPDYENGVKFINFNRNDRDKGTEIKADSKSLSQSVLNAAWPTKIFIYGFQNTIQSDSVVTIKNAYLDQGDHNVIIVDWADLAKPPNYIAARSHTAGVANRTTQLLDALAEAKICAPEDQHVIGHSLGGQIAGMASGSAKTRPGRCTGLDPAGPLYLLSTEEGRIDASDADLVDIIHTAAALWGYPAPLGHVDFYPNGGVWPQPGCTLDIDGSCSHSMAFKFFAHTISNPTAFKGTFCQTHNIVKGDCPPSSISAIMGEKVQFTTPGMYYLDAKL